jgi:hypothetical protein
MRQVVAGFRNRARGVVAGAKKIWKKIPAGKQTSRIKKGDPRFAAGVASGSGVSRGGQVTRA